MSRKEGRKEVRKEASNSREEGRKDLRKRREQTSGLSFFKRSHTLKRKEGRSGEDGWKEGRREGIESKVAKEGRPTKERWMEG